VTKLDIRVFGDPVLRQTAREVTDFDDRLRRLAGDLIETLGAAEGAGLAANQVGVLKRVFVWGLEEEAGAVVNPVVEETSDQVQLGDEGCLSFPGLFYPLQRPLRVRARFQDVHGEAHRRDVEGFLARVFLHEIDHLNGVLFIDHLARHDRKAAMKAMREYRLEHGDEGPAAAGLHLPGAAPAPPGHRPGDGRADGRAGSLLGRRGP
jgi:peptide deformylase